VAQDEAECYTFPRLSIWIKLEWTLDTLPYEAFQDESPELGFD